MIIGQKRQQQAMFEALASSNRAAGSGGGAGMGASNVGIVHGGNSVGNPGRTYTVNAYTLVQDGSGVNASIAVQTGFATPYFLLGSVVVQGPSAGVNNALLEVFLDGAVAVNTPLLSSNVQAGVPGGSTTVPILYFSFQQPGLHTFDVRIHTQGSTYLVFGFDLYLLQLG